VDLLAAAAAEPGSRAALLDLRALIAHPDPSGTRPLKHAQERNDRPGDRPLDDEMIRDAAPALERREPVEDHLEALDDEIARLRRMEAAMDRRIAEAEAERRAIEEATTPPREAPEPPPG
jgi:hypothetical protein